MGWQPEVTWNTPIPQIILAFEGKVEFVAQTNPFGSSKRKPKHDLKSQKAKLANVALIRQELRAKNRAKNG